MATEDLVQAFLVGRDSYLVNTLAYQGLLDQATNTFRLQIAKAGSQVWEDVLTVDANGLLHLRPYTVATLPAGTLGARALVTDLLGPTYLGAAVGGGAVVGLVLHTGAGWVTA